MANFTRASELARQQWAARRGASDWDWAKWTHTTTLFRGPDDGKCIVLRRHLGPSWIFSNDGIALTAKGSPLSTWHGDQTRLYYNLGGSGIYATYKKLILGVTPLAAGFYHFVTDLLPRLIISNAFVDDAPILLPRDGITRQRHAFVEGLARQAGVPVARFVPLDVFPGGPKRPVALITRELAFVDWSWCDNNRRDGAPDWHLPPLSALQLTRSAVLAGRKHSNKAHTIVVVLRHKAPTRRLAASCEDALLRAARSMNRNITLFADDDPAVLDVDAALNIFRDADLVIGVHGAGLTNALFCRSTCAILEFALPQPHARYYRHIAAATDSPYAAIPAHAHPVIGEESTLPQHAPKTTSMIPPAYAARYVCPDADESTIRETMRDLLFRTRVAARRSEAAWSRVGTRGD